MARAPSLLLLFALLTASCNPEDTDAAGSGKAIMHRPSETTKKSVKKTVTSIPDLPKFEDLDLTTAKQGEGPGHWVTVNWVEHGEIGVLIMLPESRSPTVKGNYNALRQRWPDFIDEAIAAIWNEIVGYEHQEYAPDPKSDYFAFEIPEEPMSADPEWDFHINSEPGWIIDLVGWKIVGGQGIF